MATIDDVLRIQNERQILQPPTSPETHRKNLAAASTPATTTFALKNTTSAASLYVTVSALDTTRNSNVWMLQSDGVTPYYPQNPSQDQQPLQANCTIVLGGPGTTRNITIPNTLVGGRVYFCKDAPLTFKLNRGGAGAALVEPSVTNPSDANYNLYWSFVEFTYNSVELFVNITYVDFISIPVSLQLQNSDGNVRTIEGIPAAGLDQVCSMLQQQQSADGAGWDRLVVKHTSGANLRALSPYQGIVLSGGSLFNGYYDNYVNQVWSKYGGQDLTVDTQFTWGVVKGRVSNNQLSFSGANSISKPSSADIFANSTGAFSNTAGEAGNINARVVAAFNRGTLLANSNQPSGEQVANYYTSNPCNHYARICHAVNLDHRGYAFPYDDVGPAGAVDQSGSLSTGIPSTLTIWIGGGATGSAKRNLNLREMARGGRQMVGGRRTFRRDLQDQQWLSADEEKKAQAALDYYSQDSQEDGRPAPMYASPGADLEMGSPEEEEDEDPSDDE